MSEVVAKTLLSRRNFFQVVVLASLISLGVNLLSSWIGDFVGALTWVKWAVGAFLVTFGWLLLLRFLLQEKQVNGRYVGVVILDPTSKQVVEIDEYALSEKLCSALKATFLENAALRASWEAEPLFHREGERAPRASIGANVQTPSEGKVRYAAVVRVRLRPEHRSISDKSIFLEAMEFCVLELLSLHLSEYFGTFGDEDKQVSTLTRHDIPSLLLQNRILSLLSTPVEDRQVFLESGLAKSPPDGELHSVIGSDGSVYERFDLKLPTGTTLSRPEQGRIRLHHKRFVLDIVSSFQGFSKNLPQLFRTYYLGRPESDLDARKVHFEVKARLRSFALFRLRGWEYYRWLDSFVRYFEQHVSFDAFLDRIHWAATESHIRASLVRQRLTEVRTTRQDQPTTSG